MDRRHQGQAGARIYTAPHLSGASQDRERPSLHLLTGLPDVRQVALVRSLRWAVGETSSPTWSARDASPICRIAG